MQLTDTAIAQLLFQPSLSSRFHLKTPSIPHPDRTVAKSPVQHFIVQPNHPFFRRHPDLGLSDSTHVRKSTQCYLIAPDVRFIYIYIYKLLEDPEEGEKDQGVQKVKRARNFED